MKRKTWNRLLSTILAASMTLSMLPLSALATEDETLETVPTQVVESAPAQEPEATETPEAEPIPEATQAPEAEPTPTPEVTEVPEAEPTPTPEATEDPEVEPTPTPGAEPTPIPEPTPTPSAAPEGDLAVEGMETDLPVEELADTDLTLLESTVSEDGKYAIKFQTAAKVTNWSGAYLVIGANAHNKGSAGAAPSEYLSSGNIKGWSGSNSDAPSGFATRMNSNTGLQENSHFIVVTDAKPDSGSEVEVGSGVYTYTFSGSSNVLKKSALETALDGYTYDKASGIPIFVALYVGSLGTSGALNGGAATMTAAEPLLKAYDGPDPKTANEVTEIVIDGTGETPTIEPGQVYIFNVGPTAATVVEAGLDQGLVDGGVDETVIDFQDSTNATIGVDAVFDANAQNPGQMAADNIADASITLALNGYYTIKYTAQYAAEGTRPKIFQLPIRVKASDAINYSLGDAVINLTEGYTDTTATVTISVTTDTDATIVSDYSEGDVRVNGEVTIDTTSTEAEFELTIPSDLKAVNSPYTYVVVTSETDGSMASFNVTINVTKAETKTWTVTFNTQGGSTVASQEVEDGKTATRPGTDPTKTGHTFKGWYTSTSGTEEFDFGTAITKNTTVYAQWTANTHSVSYNANGGTGSVPATNSSVAYDTDYTVLFTPQPTQVNKTFVGWATTSNATSAEYTSGGTTTFKMPDKDVILYAVWADKQVKVTFKANYADSEAPADEVVTITSGSSVATSDVPAWTRTGYTFDGWYDDATGGNVVAPTTATFSEDTILYAHWTQDTYTVTYAKGTAGSADMSGVTLPTTGGTIHVGTAHTVGSVTGAPTGYHFKEWQGSDDASGSTYAPNVTIAGEKDKTYTLTAVWEPNTYQVKYEAGDAGSNIGNKPGDTTATYGTTFKTANETPTWTGHTFQGWLCDKDSKTYAIDTEIPQSVLGEVANGGAITLTAQWKINKYTVTFHANAGSDTVTGMPDPDNVTVNYGGKVTKPSSDPARIGHDFKGWYTEEACTTAWDFASDTVTQAVDLYAKWDKVTYTIKYNANGGSTAEQTQTATIGATFTPTTVNDPEYTGYTFSGWFTQATGGNSFTVPTAALDATYINQHFSTDNTKTVYAHWEGATYTISGTIMKNGKVWDGATVSYTVGGTTKNVTTDADGKYEIADVPYNATVGIKVAGTYTGGGMEWEDKIENITANKTDANYSFYSLKVQAETGGKIEKGPADEKIYANGTQVAIKAAPDTGYKFTEWAKTAGPDSWNGHTGLEADDTITLPTGGEGGVALTANFERKTAKVTVDLKDVPVGGGGAKDHAHSDAITVTLDAATEGVDDVTISYAANAATGTASVKQGVEYSVKVDGVDTGLKVNVATTTTDGADVTPAYVVNWYEVKVDDADGHGFVALSDSAIATAPTVDGTTSGYYLPGSTVYIGAGPNGNYQFKDWTNSGTAGTIAASTTALTSYTTGAAAVTLTAKFIPGPYTGTITVTHNGTNVDVTTVELKSGATVAFSTAATDNTKKLTKSETGKYATPTKGITDTDTEYTVWVNGYATEQTVKFDSPDATVPVWKVQVTDNVDSARGAAGTVGTHYQSTVTATTAGITDTTTAAETTAFIYVPATDTANTSRTVNIKAEVKDAGDGKHYRLWNQGASETLWTASGATVAFAGDNANTDAQDITITGLTADVTLTADYMEQHKVTVALMGGETKYATINSPTGGSALVDHGKRVQASVTANKKYRFENWEMTTADAGKLSIYKTEDGANAETLTDGTTTGKKIWGTATDTSMWVAPTADVTVTAMFVADVFYPKIEVKYGTDNSYMNADRIELRSGNTTVASTIPNTGEAKIKLTNDSEAGRYEVDTSGNGIGADSQTAADSRATYDVYVNGYKTGKTVKYMESAEATATVFLYKVSVEPVDVSNSNAKQGGTVKVTGGTQVGGSPTSIFVPESGSGDAADRKVSLEIVSKTDGYREATGANGDRALWMTANDGSGDTLSVTNGAYTIASLTEDVTYYANLYQTFTVTVATSAGGTVAVTDPSGVTGTPLNATVDKGEKVTAEAEVDSTNYKTDGTGTKDAAFVQWAITAPTSGDTGSFGTAAADGSGTTATDTTAYYYPDANSTIQAQFKTLEVKQAGLGTGGKVEWNNGYTWGGTGKAIVAGYTADDHTVTLTLTNVGLITTNNLSASIESGAAGTDIDSTGTNAFEVTDIAADTTLAKDATVDVTIKIKGGLDVKTYTGRLIVKDGDEENDLKVTIPLKLTVGNPATYVPKLETYVDVAQGDVDDETPSSTGVLSVVGVGGDNKRWNFKNGDTEGLWVLDNVKHTTSEPSWNDVLTIYVNGYNTGKTVDNQVVVTGKPAKVGDLWTVKWSAEKYEDSTNSNATMGTPYFATQSALTGGTINVPNYNILPANVTVNGVTSNGASLAIPGGSNSITLKGMAHDDSTPFYRFDSWGTYTTATLGTNQEDTTIGTFTAATELTPTYKLQYKVTYVQAETMASTPVEVTPTTIPTFTVDGTTHTLAKGGHVMVDKGEAVTIGNTLALPDTNKFSHWKVSAAGTWADATDANHKSDASGTFTPAADTELTAVVWTLPTLSPDSKLSYDIGGGATGTNNAPAWTWTLNDATADTSATVQYKKGSGSATTLTKDTDYTVSGNVYTLTTDFLKGLEVGDDYTIVFNSSLVNGSNKFNGEATPLSGSFGITSTAAALTEVFIKVNDQRSPAEATTAHVGETANKTNEIVYKSHKAETITPSNLLTWKWYKADTAANQGVYNDATTLANYLDSIGAAQIQGPDMSGGATDSKDNYTVQEGEQGKYIFAVVTATVTGTGTVITNSIPVDYDAEVQVKEDNNVISAATGYVVFLHEKGAADHTGDIKMTWSTDKFITENDGLTGGKTYEVYVNEVEGVGDDLTAYDANKLVAAGGDDITGAASTRLAADNKAVQYWTVHENEFTFDHAKDNTVGTAQEVGEDFNSTTIGIHTVTTAKNNALDVTTAKDVAVLNGTALKVKSDAWDQDYKLTWATGTTATTSPTGSAQTSDAASNVTGLSIAAVDNITYIGGELKQNTYKISLGIKDVSNPTWTADEKPAVATAVLTLEKDGKTYTFTGTVEGDDPNKGIGGKTVTFEVPYNTDGYTLGKTNITVQDGKANTNYTETVLVAQPGLVKVDKTGKVTVDTDDKQKTIDILGATYVLPPFEISGGDEEYASELIELNYGYETNTGTGSTAENKETYTVVFENTGTGTMKEVYFEKPIGFENYFALVEASSKVTHVDGTTATEDFAWYDNSNTDTTSYTLAPGDTITIAYTVKENRHAMADAAEVTLEPTGKKGNGDTLDLTKTHKITFQVKPTTLNSLEIDKDGNASTVVTTAAVGEDLTVESYGTTPNNIPVLVESGGHLSGVKTDMELTDRSGATGDLSYQWYAVPNGTAVAADTMQDDWKIASATSSTYKVTDNEHGKTLYLMMTGAEDATGTVLSQGIKVAYDAWITLQDGSNGNAKLGDSGYTVAISTSATDIDAGKITPAWDGTAECYKTSGGALVPGITYYLWVNTLEGNGTMQMIGELGATLTANHVVEETVTYYQVKYAEDVVVENVYDIADANITDDMLSETGHDKKIDSILVKGTALSPTKISNAPAHVVKGTVVQFNTTAWTDKDYTRDWYEGTTNKNNNETDNSNAYEVTYNANKEEVKAQLDLNLYTVTVHVKGTGALTEITMTDGKGNVYATNATSGHIRATTSAMTTVSGDVALKLPYGGTGAYTVGSAVPSGTKYKNSTDGTSSDTAGIQYPYNSATEYNDKVSDTASQVITMSKTETNELAIWLDGVSWTLKVASAGVDTSDTEHTGDSLTVTAEDANPDKDTTYVAKVSRKYGWTPAAAADDEIEVTVTSAGKSDLHNVTLDSSSLTGPFELDVTSTAFDSDATPNMAAAADGSNHSVTVKLKLKNTNDDNTPLDAGNYTATLSFTYMTKEDGTLLEKKLFYKLKFTVEQDALDTVATEQDNTSVAKNATLTYKENALKTAGLSAQPDELQYLWYSMPVGTSYTVSGSDATTTLAGTGVKLLNTDKMDYDAVNGAAPTVQTADDELGKEIRLLIRPKDATVSFTGYAVSAPIYVQFPGVVEFFKDGSADKETSAPGYEVFFVNGSEVLEGTWSDSAQGYNNDTLDATKTYTAYVSNWPRADVDTTSFDTNKDNFTAVSTTIAGTTLTGNAPTNVAKAEIFTVTLEKPTKANHYQDVEAWGETFDAYPDLTATVADHELAKTSEADKNVSTILKGQTVTVTAATWTQDYELQWMSKTGTATDYTKGNKDASGSATEDYTINAKTDISGEMEQKTYTITGNVKDSTGADSTHLASATLTFTKDTTTVVLTTDSAQADATHFADGNGVNNSTVTFVAPKGQFNLTGVAASGYAVLDVDANTTETEPTTPGVDNVDLTIDKDQDDPKAMFQFFVDAISGGIKVYDDAEEPNTVDVTAADQSNVTAKNTYAVNYGYKANKKTETANDDTKDAYTVTFENTGNTDLTVNYQLKKDGTALDSITTAEKLTIENILGGGVDTTSGKGSFTVKASGNADAKKNVFTFTVPNGLHNTDDVDYTVEFTTTINGATYKAIYELDFDVEPLTVEEVASELTTESGTTYAQLKDTDIANIKLSDPEGGATPVAADAINSAELEGSKSGDLSFQWFSVPTGTTGAAAATVTYAGDGTATVALTVGGAAATKLSGNGADSSKYTVQAADWGTELYLVAFGTNNRSGNVTGAAVAGVIQMPYNGLVKINLNSTDLTTAPATAYGVKLIDSAVTDVTSDNLDEKGAIGTTWGVGSDATGDEGYYSDVPLDPAKTYDIWVETFLGSTAYVKLGTQLTNANRTQTASYFTVNFTADVAVDNKVSSVSSALAGPVVNGLSAKVGDKVLTTGTPVLAGQSAAVTMDYDAKNASSEGWDNKQHYTLNWTNAYDGTTKVTTDDVYPTADPKDITHTMTVNGTTTNNGGNTISAKLVQKLYDVALTIVDDGTTTKTATLASVKIAETGAGATYTLELDSTTADTNTGSVVDKFTNGGKITFKVPAGDYEVTAVPGDGNNGTVDTTLVKYVWNGTGSTDKATVAGLPHTPAQNGEIHIIAATYGLKWQSNYDELAPGTPMNRFADGEGFTRTGLVYGRYSIPYDSNADSNTYTLRLVNTGNKALNEVVVEGSSTDFTYDLTEASIYDAANILVGTVNAANLTDKSVTIPAGGYAQFTIQIPEDKNAQTANYAVTLSATAKEWVKADKTQETAAFDAAYQVEPATITALAVTGIETPGTSALDTDHELSGVKSQATSETGDADDSNAAEKYAQATGGIYVTWEPKDTTAKPGTSYTAKVVIAAQSNNYKFDVDSYKKFYTILGKNAADNTTLVGARVTTVTVDGETVPALELTYKFSPTAAGTPVITAQGTGGTTAEVTEITSESDVKLDYYYVISKDDIGTYLETDENRKEIINATGTGNKTTIDGHDVFFYGSPNPAKTSDEPVIPTGETVKKAAWPGTDQYGDLTPGTEYHVYAVSVPAGTEKDKVTAEMISPVGNATFTTYYEVKVAVAPAEMGEITTPTTTTNYVKPGEGIVLETTPKDEDVNIFKEWKLDEHGAGVRTAPDATDNSTPITDNATKKIKFWPTANTTITATYEGNPKLKIEGTNPSAEYSENYTTAVNLLEDGKVTNIGTSGMTGDLTLVLMPTTWQPGDSVTDGAYTNFTAQIIKTFNPDDTELSGLVLPKGGYATVAVNPVAGLKLPEGGTKPHYEAILVAYDKGSLDETTGKATVLASTKVAMNLTKDAVINVPSDILWDVYAHASLNHGVANPTDAADGVYNDWNVKVTFSDTSDEVFNANSFTGLKVLEGDWTDTAQEGYENAAATTVEEHKTSTTLANGGWTSSEDSASAVKTKTFTIEKEYIWHLWEDCNKTVGTKYNFFMEVTDSREGTVPVYKHLTLTFIDTTPAVTKVAVSNSNGTTAAHTGETLKATVTTTANTYGSDGTPGTAATATRTDADLAAVDTDKPAKMYINWYRWPLKADGTVDTTATPVLVQGTTVDASGDLSYTTVNASGVPTVATGLADANKSTYTLTKADAGYAIQAEALGDIELLGLDVATKGSWIKESENADLTPKLTVTVTKNPADVASITTSPSGVQYVTPGEGLEATVTGVPDGYYFTGWTVDKTGDAANGSFTASGAGTSAGGTETFGGGDKKATKFWPTTDATITANVDLLPTLVYTAGVLSNNGKTATYDIGTGADASNNGVPVLTGGYTQHNAGDGDPVYVLKPAATDGGSFTAAAGATNGYKVIAISDLTEENLKNWLTAGNYTITAYDVDVDANTGKGAYSAVTDDAMTARTGGYEGYDPSVTLVIVNRKQALSVTIVKDGDETESDTSAKELATVNVGITMEAFHVNTATDTAVTTENKVTYQWYVGPAGLDLTKDADLARAKAITVDDANATGKTLEVTDAVADQARKFNASGDISMENFYVLATAAEDSAYAGKAADDAGVENPKYTVAIRVSQSGDTATGDSPNHSSMGAVVNPGDSSQNSSSDTYTIQVERGKSITLSSKPGAGYQLGAWTMYALPDPATTSMTTGTAPKALGSFGSFSAAPTATSGSGDPVEFFPVGDVLILATFQDYQLLFDDSITESTTPSGTDLPANSAFSRSLTKTYDGQAIGDFKVTLTNPSNTLYNVDVTVTADDYTRASSSIGVTITGFPKTMAKDATEELALDLSKVKDAGTYTLELTAKGNSQADGKGVSVTATYTLTVTIEPKKLDGIKAEVPKPDKEFPKPGDDGVTIQTKDPDGADPTAFGPLPEDVEPKIEWLKPDPENPGEWIKVPDGEKPNPDTPYKPVVTVEPGPNYEFTDDAPTGTPDDDYTINGKDNPNDGADITVVPEYDPDNPTNGPKATLTGDAFPVLTFEDNYKTNQTAKKDFTQTINITVGGTFTWDTPEVTLTANGGTVYQVVVEDVTNAGSNTKIDLTAALETTPEDMTAGAGGAKTYTLKLTDGVTSLIDTSKKGTYVLKLEAKGDSTSSANPADDVTATYTLTINVNEKANPPGPGPSGPSTPDCPPVVIYDIGNKGVTEDSVVEEFTEKQTNPEKVPNVTAIDDYVFRGWTLTDPAKLKPGEKPELVDPKTVKVEEDTTFYAYYTAASDVDHKHYVIGYPNGTFGPADNITRGEVATIIARACLEGFVEGYDYGNPGGYSDVTDHWAYSAISFCSIHGVFKGYEDGTFRPGQPITRQELAVVVARLAGIQDGSEMPFSDTADIGDWAVSGVYTTYLHGWVNGYEDGTFRPLQNIRRDETVKVFNGYLNRGVDKEGLTGLTEYVHSGTASNITGNGTTEYMTWPDVTSEHWAYYEIIEAGNDHNYHWHDGETTPPEIWDQVWIDEVWRYHDDASDSGRDRTNQE